MGRLGFYIIVTLLAFVGGYYYGGAVPQVVYFQQDKVLQEVRDDYFRRCEVDGSTLRTDGAIEETYSCPHIKLFLVRRTVRVLSAKGGAE